MNGETITGSSFTMPGSDVVISDVVLKEGVTVETAHNPYPNSVNNEVYYENAFANATSITISLTYQTESTSYDWIYLYSDASTIYGNKKYGGKILTTETITISSNYIKIVFKTDGSGNNYYGFKAIIIPNYE